MGQIRSDAVLGPWNRRPDQNSFLALIVLDVQSSGAKNAVVLFGRTKCTTDQDQHGNCKACYASLEAPDLLLQSNLVFMVQFLEWLSDLASA